MHNTDSQFVLYDGRRLGYAQFGDLQGNPLFYCHGFPASRLEAALIDAAAKRCRVRVVAADRPGFGLSDYQPGRRIGDWPNDVVELADVLGIDRFAIVGVSGGGPYALACACRIPRRLVAVGVVCGLGPMSESWALRGMFWSRRLVFTLARRAPALLKLVHGFVFDPLLRRHPEVILSMILRTPVAADRRVLQRPDVGTTLLASIQESVREGPRGILHDLLLYTQAWDFQPQEIDLAVDLWHGEADPIVPVAHTRALVRQLPKARAVFLPREGHFSLPLDHMENILRTLVA